MEVMKEAIEYIKSQIDLDELAHSYSKSLYRKVPLHLTDSDLCNQIYDLLEEYGEDNELPENWWMDKTDDIEEIAGWVLDSK